MHGGTRETLAGRVRRILQDIGEAARRYQVSRVRIVLRLLELKRRHGFNFREAHIAGVSNPAVTPHQIAGTIPKLELLRLQARLNPARHIVMLDDKALFYAYCRSAGLTIPALVAVVDHPCGWRPDGTAIHGPAEWAALLGGLGGEIIVKPAYGAYGEGLKAYERVPEGFRDAVTGEVLSVDALAGALLASPWGRLVVQKRLRSHPEIARVTGSDTLQTVRIWSLVTAEGEFICRVSVLKVVVGGHVTDNIARGRTGNFMVALGSDDGVLRAPLLFSASGVGVEVITDHPDTSLPLKGFRLPFWDEAMTLARRATALFVPLRTIGWDVAITAEGPVLIEGNARWDPPNMLAASPADTCYADGMGDLLARLRAEAARSPGARRA